LKIFANILIFSSFISLGFSAYSQDTELLQLRSNHFIIRYHKDVSKSYVYKIKDIAEKYYRIITQEFNFVRDKPWIWDKRATIFIEKDKEAYEARSSCASWSAACVDYQRKIIYSYPQSSSFATTLVHELTHIIFHEYIKGGSVPLWLDEGMATYIENKKSIGHYDRSLYRLKRKIKDGSYIKFAELNLVTSMSLDGASDDYVKSFYLESFSIVNFIIKKYGRYKFSQLLKHIGSGYSLEASLNKVIYNFRNLEDLEKEWKTFYQG